MVIDPESGKLNRKIDQRCYQYRSMQNDCLHA